MFLFRFEGLSILAEQLAREIREGLGPGLGDTYNQQWSSIITETCDGSLKQKWNAPANFIDSRFKGTAEDKGGQ